MCVIIWNYELRVLWRAGKGDWSCQLEFQSRKTDWKALVWLLDLSDVSWSWCSRSAAYDKSAARNTGNKHREQTQKTTGREKFSRILLIVLLLLLSVLLSVVMLMSLACDRVTWEMGDPERWSTNRNINEIINIHLENRNINALQLSNFYYLFII